MHRTIKTAIFAAIFIVVSGNQIAVAANARNLDRGIWNEYTTEQKATLLSGFSWCFEPKNPRKNAPERNISVAVIDIDKKISGSGEDFIHIMANAIKKSPLLKHDPYAEYSNIDGLWWRQVDEKDRQAYVQGVLWCRAGAKGAASLSGDAATKSAMAILDNGTS